MESQRLPPLRHVDRVACDLFLLIAAWVAGWAEAVAASWRHPPARGPAGRRAGHSGRAAGEVARQTVSPATSVVTERYMASAHGRSLSVPLIRPWAVAPTNTA